MKQWVFTSSSARQSPARTAPPVMNGTTPLEKTFFLGRQPILDSQQEIVGYELLFRSTEKNMSEFDSPDQASMSVISSTLAGFGFRKVLGEKAGFINVTQDVLMSDLI